MRYFDGSKSDLLQDCYTLTMLHEKQNGYYVELGSGDPEEGNNTWLLEKNYGWSGLAIDIEQGLADKYNAERSNKCIAADALTFDYKKYFEENDFPKVIDYLQIDIDGHQDSLCLLALLALPMLQYRFRVITIEHDLSANFKLEAMRTAQREILHSLGYKLSAQLDSEDWWVDEKELPRPIYGGQVNMQMRHPQIDQRN